MSASMTAVVVLAAIALALLVAAMVIALWPWRIEATLKAVTKDAVISLAGGLQVAGLSASMAAILGGPGVFALHWRARELFRRPIAQVSPEAFFDWLDAVLSSPDAPPTFLGRLTKRVKEWLLRRTDTEKLPQLGLRIVSDCRDVSFHGAITCGFSDPALSGKTAAWLYPLAGVLAPFGVLDVSIDWSGKTILDADLDASLRVVPARVALEGLKFGFRHVHVLRAAPPVSSTMKPATTTR